MPRGYDNKDVKLFSPTEASKLRECMADAVYLVNRGYSIDSAIQFTASHYRCPSRQIQMLTRAICSDKSLERKQLRELKAEALKGETLYIDGFNTIITLEILFSGGTLFIGRDGCVRDIAGMRGNYRLIEETNKAIELIAKITSELEVGKVVFYLDSPISNSGNLKTRIFEHIDSFSCPLEVELMFNPDVQLYDKSVVISADGIILENCVSWFNLSRYCLEKENRKVAVDFTNIDKQKIKLL